jgi:hypothetical protein
MFGALNHGVYLDSMTEQRGALKAEVSTKWGSTVPLFFVLFFRNLFWTTPR